MARYQEPLTAVIDAGHDIKIASFGIAWMKDVNLPRVSILDYINNVANAALYPNTFAK